MKRFFLFIFNVLFLIFIYLISFFINIKIGRIYTSRVGHICYNLDNYITNKENFKTHQIHLFATDKNVINKTMLELYKRSDSLIFFSRFFFYPFKFLELHFPKSKLLINSYEGIKISQKIGKTVI